MNDGVGVDDDGGGGGGGGGKGDLLLTKEVLLRIWAYLPSMYVPITLVSWIVVSPLFPSSVSARMVTKPVG